MQIARLLRGLAVIGSGVLVLGGCAPEYGDYDYPVSSSRIVASPKRHAAKPQQPVAVLEKPLLPSPDRALLAAQPAPDCESKLASTDALAGVERQPEAPVTWVATREGGEQTAAGEASGARDLASPAPAPKIDANADLALRIKLEYERECYKQAESRVRQRLQRLQTWTTDTVDAANRKTDGAR